MGRLSNWIEKIFWNCVELIEYIGQITNLGYELTNVIIFVIIQPSLILIFLILWLLEKRKNKKLSSFKNENSPSPFKEFLWRISRVLSFLVFLIELIISKVFYLKSNISDPLSGLKLYNIKIIIQYEISPERIVAIIFFEKYPTSIAIKIAMIFGSS